MDFVFIMLKKYSTVQSLVGITIEFYLMPLAYMKIILYFY